MGIETIIKLLVSLIGEYLFKPSSAAKYAKWFLRMRDYLNLLFPEDRYPVASFEGTSLKGMRAETFAVPIEAVKEESKKRGFNIPFIKGI